MRPLFRNILLPMIFTGLVGCGGGTPPILPPTVDIGDMTVSGRGTEGDPYIMPNTAPPGLGMGIGDFHARGGYWRFPVSQVTERHFGTDQAALTAMTQNAGENEWILRYSEVGPTVAARNRSLSRNATGAGYIGCSETAGCEHRLTVHGADPAPPQYGTFAMATLRMDAAGKDYKSFAAVHGGLQTLPMTMPVLGSAFYDGTFDGRWFTTYRSGGTDARTMVMEEPASARIRLAVDFTRGTVFLFTRIPGASPGGHHSAELSGTGKIVGNVLVGEFTATLSRIPNPLILSGPMTGTFYGPGALEIAATLRDGDTTGGRLLGGFWAGRPVPPSRR